MDRQVKAVIRAQLCRVVRVHEFPLRCKGCNMGGNIIPGRELNNEEDQNRNQK